MKGILKMKKQNKDTVFNIKVESDIKNRFVAVAKENDETASQLIRKFMKEYLIKHSQKTMKFN